jgi:glycosyltransferase involved in cell wall biosynthesis
MGKSLLVGWSSGFMSEGDEMGSKPLVSGIIIFLNEEEFIKEAIESVFAQTYDNWELLLVDDGSIDGSTAIARWYAEKYPMKVRYLEHDGHQNLGMSASRNKGIRNAKGEYIAFLDADDIWLSPKLEQQVALLDSQPEAAMVFGPTEFWYSWTGNPEDIERDGMREINVQANTLFKPPTLLTLLLQNKASTPATCSVLVRLEVFKHTGEFEEAFRGMYEDQAFFAKVYLKVPVFVTSKCWDKYRQHQNSCCSVAEKTGQFHRVNPNPAHFTFLKWVESYLSEQEVENTKVWKALQKCLWPYRNPLLYRLLVPLQHFVKQMKELLKLIGRRTLPVPIRRWLRAQYARS